MPQEFAIVDLFAGPGGLGEGFSKAGADEETRMQIHLSIEMDDHAIQTLRLRAFLRSFEQFPKEFYEAVNSGTPLPCWAELYPSQWKMALTEARQCVLGRKGVFEELASKLDNLREVYHGNTILIGGPPCQAYSLAGRSRNKGKVDYIPENDERHYLYREYVRILDRLNPAVFIMENVKGMLSSKVDGGGIFSKVLDDLENAGDGYRLLPLAKTTPMDASRAAASDFLIRAEDYGVPQARHRVIILGIRNDVAQGVSLEGPILGNPRAQVSVSEALSGLSGLRSGLSRKDGVDAWQAALRDQAFSIANAEDVPDQVRQTARSIYIANELPHLRCSSWKGKMIGMPENLRDWFADDRLACTLQHETRGHIREDLGRYLYSAAFTRCFDVTPKLKEFPDFLQPRHINRASGDFADRFRTQAAHRPATTITSHIAKDGHYYIHPDPMQCRSLSVREAARLQTFPDNYMFCGPRTKQYHQVGNAVPPYLAWQIAKAVRYLLG